VEAEYIRAEILPDFFKHFWVRRMALDRRNYKQLVETTVEVASKVRGWAPRMNESLGVGQRRRRTVPSKVMGVRVTFRRSQGVV